jgi:hypothetical protein
MVSGKNIIIFSRLIYIYALLLQNQRQLVFPVYSLSIHLPDKDYGHLNQSENATSLKEDDIIICSLLFTDLIVPKLS